MRYAFFMQVAHQNHIQHIYIAHQLDDVLETYIFQCKRDMLCDWYGLAATSKRQDVWVHRPLLGYEKEELEAYCIKQHVPYGIDESNLTDAYARNRIRHHNIASLSREEKEAMLAEIEQKNAYFTAMRKEWDTWLDTKPDTDAILAKDWMALERWLFLQTHQHFARKHVLSLQSQLHSDCLIDLGAYELERHMDALYCLPKEDMQPILIQNIEYGCTPHYEWRQEGKTIEGFTVDASDFPLCVRKVQAGDFIQLRLGKKKLSRFFVDRKIPKIMRKRWLVVTNRSGDVIFVPGIGCDIAHFSEHPNVFMLQLTSLTKEITYD